MYRAVYQRRTVTCLATLSEFDCTVVLQQKCDNATLIIFISTTTTTTHSLSRLAWSWFGGRLAPFYIHQMNRVNSRNGCAMMTAPLTLSWILLLYYITHRRQSWIQYGRLCWKSTVTETGNKLIGNKVHCRHIRSTLLPVLATNRQQLEFDSLSRSTLSPTRSTLSPECCTSLRLCCQCVRGQSDTVDFVDFQQSRPCWIQLRRHCVPGFRLSGRYGTEW